MPICESSLNSSLRRFIFLFFSNGRLVPNAFAITVSALLPFMAGCPENDSNSHTENADKIVCNKFDVHSELNGSILSIILETDLPDSTDIIISVSRPYSEKGSPAVYLVDYFSEKSKAAEWKSKREILLDNEKWKNSLDKKQEEMSRIGLRFDVETIGDKIELSMIVPVNQSDSRFGEQNSKLTGTAVNTDGIRIIESEIEIDYPIEKLATAPNVFPSYDPVNLDVGRKYYLSEQTPLMQAYNPEDPIADLEKMVLIPKQGIIEILDVLNYQGNPWYKVNAYGSNNVKIGTGYVNSTALIGQQLMLP